MRGAVAVFAALLVLGGCGRFRKTHPVPPPPGPMPVRIPEKPTISGPVAVELAAPPEIVVAVDVAPVGSLPTTPKAAPAAAPKRRMRASRPAPTVEPKAPSVEAPASETAVPAYRLGKLRTADERARLRRETDKLLERCGAALAAAAGRTLTEAQSEMLRRVEEFAKGARETMEKDGEEARNLASKGRTFAEALLAELK